MPSPPASRFSINLLENDRNELLFLKRAAWLKLGPGKWGFPAGHIEDNESPEQCALRELREEIGDRFEARLIQTCGPIRDTLYGGKYEIHLFHHRWLDGEVQLNHEHTDMAWVSKEDFKDLDAMNGVDEDILYLGIWPREYLRKDKLPKGR